MAIWMCWKQEMQEFRQHIEYYIGKGQLHPTSAATSWQMKTITDASWQDNMPSG